MQNWKILATNTELNCKRIYITSHIILLKLKSILLNFHVINLVLLNDLRHFPDFFKIEMLKDLFKKVKPRKDWNSSFVESFLELLYIFEQWREIRTKLFSLNFLHCETCSHKKK